MVSDNYTLTRQHDAAAVNWGGDWVMPMNTEIDELLNASNLTWTWTALNGVNGYRVSSTNGNSIFLPAVGSMYDKSLTTPNALGTYWSSSPQIEPDYETQTDWETKYAYKILFRKETNRLENLFGNKAFGSSVRPIIRRNTAPYTFHGVWKEISETNTWSAGGFTATNGWTTNFPRTDSNNLHKLTATLQQSGKVKISFDWGVNSNNWNYGRFVLYFYVNGKLVKTDHTYNCEYTNDPAHPSFEYTIENAVAGHTIVTWTVLRNPGSWADTNVTVTKQ